MGNLWVKSSVPLRVDPERWRDYPYFFESFEQYGIELPATVVVLWKPLKEYLDAIVTDDEGSEDVLDYIASIREMLMGGEDVPPLLLSKGRLFDGQHRAWAAYGARKLFAPTVDITPYWPAKRG
jgi:hypothetical protein